MANGSTVAWGSDVPISLPEPTDADTPMIVQFGGFAFGPNGFTTDASQADIDDFFQPFYAPVNPPDGEPVR